MKRVTPIFHARVAADGSRLEFIAAESPQRKRHLANLAGCVVDVVVRKHREQRSLDQNAYWHGVAFPILADALGYDADEVDELKFYVMGEWSGWRQSRTGDRLPNKMHTSDLDTAEGADFTDWLIRFGAKLPGGGVIIPLPKEAEAA